MRRQNTVTALVGWVWLVLVVVGVTAMQAGADSNAALSDVQRLRAEVHALKGQLLEARYQLATCEAQQHATALARERQALEAEFRDALAPPEGAIFDWQTLTFASPPKPAEKTP